MKNIKKFFSFIVLPLTLNSFSQLNIFTNKTFSSSYLILANIPKANANENDWVLYRTHLRDGLKAFYEEKDYEKAIRNFDIAIQNAPEWDKERIGLAYYLRGNAKNKIDDFRGAIDDWETSANKFPLFEDFFKNDKTQISNYYADIAVAKSRLNSDDKLSKEIINLFEKCIKLDKNNKRNYLLYALSLKDESSSIKILNKYIKIDPKDGETYSMRGMFWNFKNNKGQACSDWNKALSLGYSKAESNINKYSWCKKYR